VELKNVHLQNGFILKQSQIDKQSSWAFKISTVFR